MEALRFTVQKKLLELVQCPLPCLTDPANVLIEVAYAGICGTDLHILEGKFPCNRNPFTPGHEFSGTVSDVGCDVNTLQPGDLVSVDPNSGCRQCFPCRTGKPHYCRIAGINTAIGVNRDGGWASHVVVRQEQVHKLPSRVTLEQGVLTEPLSCLAHAWDRTSPINVGERILILGAGIAGNLLTCVLHLQGHRNVTVSEPNEARLALAERLDTCQVLLTPEELKAKEESDPKFRFDVVFDCSGSIAALQHGFSLLNYGGRLCLYGIAMPEEKLAISPYDMFRKELTIFGTAINPFTFPKALALLQAMGDRYLNYERLGIQTFKLEEYKEAIECLKTGKIAKAVFKLDMD